MKNKEFDAYVRHQISKEEQIMNERSEKRIEHAFKNPKEQRFVRHVTWRTIAMAAIILVLLCGVALAAVSWNSQELLTHRQNDGTSVVNEELLKFTQALNTPYSSEKIRLEMVDAIADNASVVMAWHVTNTSETTLYLVSDITVNGSMMDGGSTYNASQVFLAPGETIESGMNMRVDEAMPVNNPYNLNIAVHCFEPKGEIVNMPPLDGNAEDGAAEEAKARTWVDQQVAMGNVVLAGDGGIELGSEYYGSGMTYLEGLEAYGAMTLADTLTASFELANNAWLKSIEGSEVAQKDNGSYVLRLTHATLTPNTLTIDLERVFKTKEDAEAFSIYYTSKHDSHWGFRLLDEPEGWFMNSSGWATTEVPVEAEDGTWVWGYGIEAMSFTGVPTSFTIVPERTEGEGFNTVQYPDEGITFTFE